MIAGIVAGGNPVAPAEPSVGAGVRFIRFAQSINATTNSLTFTSVPLVGDWIVAMGFWSSTTPSSPNEAEGWTSLGTRGDGNGYSAIVQAYKQVQPGDTSTITPWDEFGGLQKYNCAWVLRSSDPDATWADLFGDVKRSYGNVALSDYALDLDDDWLVLAAIHARGSGSAPTVGSEWAVDANYDSGPLNRRVFSGRKTSPTGAIDMSTLVNNPNNGGGGIASIALRYTAPGELPPVDTDYLQDISTGERRSIIGFSTNGIDFFGDMSNILNGNESENSQFFYNRTNENWQWMKFDLYTPRVIDEFTWVQSGGTWQGFWNFEGSNDDVNWDLIGQFHLDNGVFPFTNETPYRWYRMRGESGSRSSSPYVREIKFKAGPA